MKAASSRDVFKQLARNGAELATFAWDKEGPDESETPRHQHHGGGADGRPPGWREQGVPNA